MNIQNILQCAGTLLHEIFYQQAAPPSHGDSLTLNEQIQQWAVKHGRIVSKPIIRDTEVWRIEIRDKTRDDIIDIWQESLNTEAVESSYPIAVDFVSGRTGAAQSYNCSLETLHATLETIEQLSRSLDDFARYGLP
jgi:hypothetical protein